MMFAGPVGAAAGGAQALPNFFKAWAVVINDMESNDEEKEHACRGLCAVLKAHARSAVSDSQTLEYVAMAFLSWEGPEVGIPLQQSNPALAQEFRAVLGGFCQNLGPQAWQALTNRWRPALRQQVRQSFGV